MIKGLVSIIVPIYNKAKVLEKCVLSLINQTYEKIEILLIDDGSTDCSNDVCLKFKNIDKRVAVIRQNNRGVSAARNIGLAKSNGEFIMFVDADDYVDSSYVENYLRYMNDNIDCVYGEFQRNDINGLLVGVDNKFDSPIYIVNDKKVDWFSAENFHFSVWGALFRGEKIGGIQFDKRLYVGEDTLFFIRVIMKCKTIVHIPDYSYHYVQNSESAFFGKVDAKKLTNIDAYEKIARLLEKASYNSSGAYLKLFDGMLYLFYKSTEKNNCDFNQAIRNKFMKNKNAIRRSIIGNYKLIAKYYLLLYAPRILEKMITNRGRTKD